MDNEQIIFDKNNDRNKIMVDYLAIRVNIILYYIMLLIVKTHMKDIEKSDSIAYILV